MSVIWQSPFLFQGCYSRCGLDPFHQYFRRQCDAAVSNPRDLLAPGRLKQDQISKPYGHFFDRLSFQIRDSCPLLWVSNREQDIGQNTSNDQGHKNYAEQIKRQPNKDNYQCSNQYFCSCCPANGSSLVCSRLRLHEHNPFKNKYKVILV